MGSNSAVDRFARMALSMDSVADSFFRIAEAANDAVTRRNAENAGTVLRNLAAALDAAQEGHPGALEALAIDTTAVLFSRAFRDAMESRLAEAVVIGGAA